jgi:hypothetical protein
MAFNGVQLTGIEKSEAKKGKKERERKGKKGKKEKRKEGGGIKKEKMTASQ